jgi:hypothetical protein
MTGRLFGVSKDTIQWHYKTYVAHVTKHYANGRPHIFTRERHDDLISFIAKAYASNRASMMHDIVHQMVERYGKVMNISSIRPMLDGDLRAKSRGGVPMQEKRLQVTAEDQPLASLALPLPKRSKVFRPMSSITWTKWAIRNRPAATNRYAVSQVLILTPMFTTRFREPGGISRSSDVSERADLFSDH